MTLEQCMMPREIYWRIKLAHIAHRPEIMDLWLQEMYFSPKAAKILVQEQNLDSPDSLYVPSYKNVYDIWNIM